MEHVGHQIKLIRQSIGMSQKTLCQGICTQSNISRIENGTHVPSYILLTELAVRLGVDTDELYPDQRNCFEMDIVKVRVYKLLEEQNYQAIHQLLKMDEEQIEKKYLRFYYWAKAVTAFHVQENLDEAKKYIQLAKETKRHIYDAYLEINIRHVETVLYRNDYCDEEIIAVYQDIIELINVNKINGNLVIKILLSISTYHYHKKEYHLTNKASSLAIKLLKKARSVYLLDYHLYNEATSRYYMGVNRLHLVGQFLCE